MQCIDRHGSSDALDNAEYLDDLDEGEGILYDEY